MTEQTKERKSKSNFVWRTVIITLHSFCLCLDCFISFLSLCLSAPMCGLCFTSFLHFAGPLRARQLELHDLSPRCDRTISKSLSLALPICVCANVMTAWVPLCFFPQVSKKSSRKKCGGLKWLDELYNDGLSVRAHSISKTKMLAAFSEGVINSTNK